VAFKAAITFPTDYARADNNLSLDHIAAITVSGSEEMMNGAWRNEESEQNTGS
jgi:hypothetical protein